MYNTCAFGLAPDSSPASTVLIRLCAGSIEFTEIESLMRRLCREQNADEMMNFTALGINMIAMRRLHIQGVKLFDGEDEKAKQSEDMLMLRLAAALAWVRMNAWHSKYLCGILRAVFLEEELNPQSGAVPPGKVWYPKANNNIARARAWAKKEAEEMRRLAFDTPHNKELAQCIYN